MQPKANLADFQFGEKIFRVTDRVMVDQPVSDILCSNFIELGFGFQVEGMWSEMLFNRSFEKIPQLPPATYDWFGGPHLTGQDWRGEEWYHSVYEHNRWYACPAQDVPQALAPDSTYLVEHAPFYSLKVEQEKGGIHGEQCVTVYNFEEERLSLIHI